ncbi:MAG TPA: DoxX family protein [Puia sp.]|nr:DoxX family protein [Puia sp.]
MNLSYNALRVRKITYWATTVFVAMAFFVTGVGNLAPIAHIAQDMSHLGYPRYFLNILGTWKILGAVAIVLPGVSRLKEWAYAGMIFDLTGAAFSRSALGDSVIMVIVPIAIASLVVISWALRPEERRLLRFVAGRPPL